MTLNTRVTVLAVMSKSEWRKRPALAIEETTDIFGAISGDLPEELCVLVDEAQFLKRHHVYDLARVVDGVEHTRHGFGESDFHCQIVQKVQISLAFSETRLTEIKTIYQYCKEKKA